MKKYLIILFIFLLQPVVGQEDIERFKIYNITHINTSLLLDTRTGRIWQIQIGINYNSKRLTSVLSDTKQASTLVEIEEDWNNCFEYKLKYWEEEYNSKPDSIVRAEMKAYWKPYTLKNKIESEKIYIARCVRSLHSRNGPHSGSSQIILLNSEC
jgi:2-succinyl-5-enolpyruvyl-6-hydroxy-3-cyclohexene-1-carboxylate synthase